MSEHAPATRTRRGLCKPLMAAGPRIRQDGRAAGTSFWSFGAAGHAGLAQRRVDGLPPLWLRHGQQCHHGVAMWRRGIPWRSS